MTDIVTIYVDLFECVNTHTRIYTCSTEVDFILIGVDGSGRTDVEFYFFFCSFLVLWNVQSRSLSHLIPNTFSPTISSRPARVSSDASFHSFTGQAPTGT